MSQEKIVLAISALQLALADAGLSGVSVTVAVASSTVINNVTGGDTKPDDKPAGRGRRGAGSDKEVTDKETQTEQTEKEQQQTDKPAGRGRGRGANNAETSAAETQDAKGGTGRRSRSGGKKDEPIKDTPEQAEMRENLTADLRVLADHDEAIDDVTEALQRTGAPSIKQVPSELLAQFDEDIGAIFEKYNLA